MVWKVLEALPEQLVILSVCIFNGTKIRQTFFLKK